MDLIKHAARCLDCYLGAMQHWLASPLVVLLGFIATAITIAQFIVSVAKWLLPLMRRATGKRYRLSIFIVLSCFVATVIISPLSWAAIVTVSAKYGQNHLEAALYPAMINGMSLSGSMVLLTAVKMKERLPILPCFMIMFGLLSAAVFCSFSSLLLWERCLIDVIPGVILVEFVIGMHAHVLAPLQSMKHSSPATWPLQEPVTEPGEQLGADHQG